MRVWELIPEAIRADLELHGGRGMDADNRHYAIAAIAAVRSLELHAATIRVVARYGSKKNART